MENDKTFEEYLKQTNLSKNTLASYLWTVKYFTEHYDCLSKENLLAYKGYLLEYYKPKTVNLRIQGINKYLCFIGKDTLQLKFVKVQQKNFLENVISNADYQFLKTKLKADGNLEWYFVIWFLAATGARVSELVQIKVEHVKAGYFDLYCKGGKLRRLYIPVTLKNEALDWLQTVNRTYGLDEKVVYPHSFRHHYAKNFLEKYNDIALLADLMGHGSIETTRIYLRKTASEQQNIVDTIVTW